MNESELLLRKNYLELKEWEAILEKADQFFQGVSSPINGRVLAIQKLLLIYGIAVTKKTNMSSSIIFFRE